MSTATLSLVSPPAATEVASCRHCGDRCDVPVVSASGTFCCRGCEAVYRIIANHGLGAFYTCAPEASVVKPRTTADPERFAVLDDPAVHHRFVDARPDGRATATFVLPAIHCASCVWLLERLHCLDPAIGRSEVDLYRRTLRVEFTPGALTLRRLAEQIAALGYEPQLDPERLPAAMPASRRSLYLRIGVAGFAFGNVMLFSIPRYANGAPLEPEFQRLFDVLNLLFALPVLFFSASVYFQSAWRALWARTMVLDIPIALGLLALFGRSVFDIATGTGEGFLDSFAGLVFFLLIGRLFQQKAFDRIAFDRTMRSFLPLSVRVERGATAEMTRIDALQPGDTIVIRPGEVVPADSVLLGEHGAIDYAFVTGESRAHDVKRDAVVSAGGRAVGQSLRLAVIRPVSQGRLADLWNHPVFARAKTHWLATVSSRFGWWFTAGALALALIGAVAWWPDAAMSLQVATAVLIIACPCALTLAAPIALGTAMGQLGRSGCYLKHPAVALDLARIDSIVFDKTGTLTTTVGDAGIVSSGFTLHEFARIRRLAAESVHPISRAIVGRAPVTGTVSAVREEAGRGLAGQVDGIRVAIGTAEFISSLGRDWLPHDDRTWAIVGDSRPGWIRVEGTEREGIADAVRRLSRSVRVSLYSGDGSQQVERWRDLFGRHLRARMTPEAKLSAIRKRQARGRRVLMVGDGLNDAGALAGADVGLAVSDDTACLVPACDGVIRGDRVRFLPEYLRYARRGRRVIAICFTVSVLYNGLGLALALAGRLTPLATAILMPVSSLTVIALAAGLMRRGARELPA